MRAQVRVLLASFLGYESSLFKLKSARKMCVLSILPLLVGIDAQRMVPERACVCSGPYPCRELVVGCCCPLNVERHHHNVGCLSDD